MATEPDLTDQLAGALGLAHLMAQHGFPLPVPTGSLSPAQIWASSDQELAALLKLPPASQPRLLEFRRRFEAPAAWRQMKRAGIELVALGDPDYPPWLSHIHDPPAGLFLRSGKGVGVLARLRELNHRPGVAIVGARGASRYGIDAALMIAEALSRAGVTVISGMAGGIDAAAHRGGLAGGAGSIAVLGGGADVIYPKTNTRLYGELLAHGIVISEYPPGTQPLPWRFPARNRIISGLARGVLVVEAKQKSGALITADFCLEEGRDVWAVPGSIFSDLSQGPHALLRLGASAVTSAADVMEALGIDDPEGSDTGSRQQSQPENQLQVDVLNLSPDEQLVLRQLEARPQLPDAIATQACLNGARAAAALITLELRGLARNDPLRGYSR